jgi:hypothetical protein
MWTGLTWFIMPLLAIRFGFLGIAYATAIIATSSIATVIMARRIVPFDISLTLKTPFFSAVVMSLFLLITLSSKTSVATIFILGAMSITVYLFAVFFLEGKQFVQTTINYFKFKHA